MLPAPPAPPWATLKISVLPVEGEARRVSTETQESHLECAGAAAIRDGAASADTARGSRAAGTALGQVTAEEGVRDRGGRVNAIVEAAAEPAAARARIPGAAAAAAAANRLVADEASRW